MSDEKKNNKLPTQAPDAAAAAEQVPATENQKAKIVETDNNQNGYLTARRAARKSGVKQ